jgi:hypothetical protein
MGDKSPKAKDKSKKQHDAGKNQKSSAAAEKQKAQSPAVPKKGKLSRAPPSRRSDRRHSGPGGGDPRRWSPRSHARARQDEPALVLALHLASERGRVAPRRHMQERQHL